jgi:hypothetical protein
MRFHLLYEAYFQLILFKGLILLQIFKYSLTKL